MSKENELEERRAYPPSKPWERHVQTILTALILTGIVWLGNTTNENKYQLGIMVERVSQITEKLIDLKSVANDRYTGAEGRKLAERVDKLEDDFNNHVRNDYKTGMIK